MYFVHSKQKYYVMYPKRNTKIIVRDIIEMVRKSEQNPFVSPVTKGSYDKMEPKP